MQNLFSDVPTEVLISLGIIIFLVFILFMMSISNRIKLKRLKAKYNKFMNGSGEVNIEELLERCIDKVNDVSAKNREIEVHINSIERNLLQCVQKIGIIRYNAFENVGSDLSFSICLLDNNDNGIILSGIYSRDSSSTYAKPIVSGKSRYSLSAEEIQALDTAKRMSKEKAYTEK